MATLPRLNQHSGTQFSRSSNLTPNRRAEYLLKKNKFAPDASKERFQVHKWKDPKSRQKYTKKLEQLQNRLKNSRTRLMTVPTKPTHKPVTSLLPPRGQILPPIRLVVNQTNNILSSFSENDYISRKESLFYQHKKNKRWTKRREDDTAPSPVSRIRRSLLFNIQRFEKDEEVADNIPEEDLIVKEEETEIPKDSLKYQIVQSDIINEESVTIVGSSVNSELDGQNNSSPDVANKSARFARKVSINKVEAHSYPVLPEFNKYYSKDNTKTPEIIRNIRRESIGNTPNSRNSINLEKYPKLSPIQPRRGSMQSPQKSPSMGKLSSLPTDSYHLSTGGTKRTRSRIRRSLRGDTREYADSPRFTKSKQKKRNMYLMHKWRAAIRLSIWMRRLCHAHHIIADDSYNICYADDVKDENAKKADILFDVTNYRTKNQMRVQETTKAILVMQPELRTTQDLQTVISLLSLCILTFNRLETEVFAVQVTTKPLSDPYNLTYEVGTVKASLRNLKVIADHADGIQQNIAKFGVFVSFEGKRVVTREHRLALNYYVLLAGSAVVIKEDERGNTNPTWFMQRGDVFGEREILDDQAWGWSVVTVDTCEFLMLDKRDYTDIFLSGGGSGAFKDPERGSFIKNLEVFKDWPIELLESNRQKCFFRYYKRGTLLSKNIADSDWIYVVKSGSCGVLKKLQVKEMAEKVIYEKYRKELKPPVIDICNPQLVKKQKSISSQQHEKRINEKLNMSLQDHILTPYQKIEMNKLLEELNIDKKEALETVFEEDETETELEDSSGDEVDKTIAMNNKLAPESDMLKQLNGRVPSPMKSAYLQTGITKEKSNLSLKSEKKKNRNHKIPSVVISDDLSMNVATDDEVDFEKNSIGQTTVDDFLSKIETSSKKSSQNRTLSDFKPVFLNLRTITKGGMCGLAHELYQEQPKLILVSNGAECLLIKKKFYLDNLPNEALRQLRKIEHPYPTENTIEDNYWRLMAWNALQRQTIRRFFAHNTVL